MPAHTWPPGHNNPPPPRLAGHIRVRLPVTNETNSLLQPLLTQSLPSPNPADVVVEEEKRKRRLACQREAYHQASWGNLDLINQSIPCVVLDFIPEKELERVRIDGHFAIKLKDHQVKGIKFMWDNCFESVDKIRENAGSGCILAHCMGLGKSLQVVTIAHTVLTNRLCLVDRVLVVCPVSTIFNWINEFKLWLPTSSDVKVYEMMNSKDNPSRTGVLRSWMESGGVMVIGYDMYRILTDKTNTKISAEDRVVITCSLVDPGPELVVCDEGHTLKNEKSAVATALSNISTRRRIILTGTPIQNNLLEYHAMVQFVKPLLLGTAAHFTDFFAKPINNGQSADSTEYDVRIMKQRSHVLHKMLEGTVQRFDSSFLAPFLPPKYEYVLYLKLSDLQRKLYEQYLSERSNFDCNHNRPGLLADFHELERICTHPKALTDTQIANNEENDETEAPIQRRSSNWWSRLVRDEDMSRMEHSAKITLLFDILRRCKMSGEKVLVFSQFLHTLNLIEEFLAGEDDNEDPLGTWRLGQDYFRLDGQTTLEDRKDACNSFNNPCNLHSRLFLISTKAGGVGINLVAANRVILFDASWNPSHDVQSIFRIYRLGQTKTCFVYRFIAQGTIEEKIYDRQVTKQSLSCRVIDEHQIKRHFSARDLNKLYVYDPNSHLNRPTSPKPRDSLLADLALERKDWLLAFHEHDPLLEHKPEEDLTEEEKEISWYEFLHSLKTL